MSRFENAWAVPRVLSFVVQKTKINDERHEAKERTMSITVTIEEAQANLKDLVHGLAPGDEIVITENQQTVAKIVSQAVKPGKRPPPGLGKGSILFMAPGFDEPLEEMKEYIE
jgi:antitoxin (DNA-binding transcriptional repressor) of toxin-antitoxin stability system